MRRVFGWGARALRFIGGLSELLAWLLAMIGFSAFWHEPPDVWTETQRERLRAMRGWFRATMLCGPWFALFVPTEPGWTKVAVAAVKALVLFGVLSIPIIFALVHLGRLLRAPRGFYDAGAGAAAIGIGYALVSAEDLRVGPFVIGALWGWLYWFFSSRPRPPYA